jgi:hypothetical protein
MSFELFMFLLLAVALLTGLTTQAVKNSLKKKGKEYASNAIAGYVAIMLSIAVFIGYMILIDGTLTAALLVYLIALAFLSWLAAMVGYDKVVQVITQLKKLKGGI